MISYILEQLTLIIKHSQAQLRADIIKEIRQAEALIRSDIAYKRSRRSKKLRSYNKFVR